MFNTRMLSDSILIGMHEKVHACACMHAWVQPRKNAAQQNLDILTRNNMCTTRVLNNSACYIDIHRKVCACNRVIKMETT